VILSFLVNILVAVLWLLLMGGGVIDFAFGMVLGFLLLVLFRWVLKSEDYVRRVLAFFLFVLVFIREFLKSNLVVASAVLFRPVEDIHPNFLTLDVSDMELWEIYVLSQCITLTPGTTTVDLIEEGRTLVVHAFDADDPDEVRQSIRTTLKSAIMRFSR